MQNSKHQSDAGSFSAPHGLDVGGDDDHIFERANTFENQPKEKLRSSTSSNGALRNIHLGSLADQHPIEGIVKEESDSSIMSTEKSPDKNEENLIVASPKIEEEEKLGTEIEENQNKIRLSIK